MRGALLGSVFSLLCVSTPCFCLFGRGQATGGNKITLLWVPSESFSDWTAVSDAFRRSEEFKLSAGLTPEMLTPGFQAQMDPWVRQGRFEPALRLPGDPILPLIAENPQAPRPNDPLQRLAASRLDYQEHGGALPAGFIPGGGAVSARLLPDLQRMGFKWTAVGDYGEDWTRAADLTLVPLKTVRTFGQPLTAKDISLPDYPAPSIYLIDEAEGLVPQGSMLSLLAELTGPKRPKQAWSTISEAASARDTAEARSTGTWPTWLGDYTPWTQAPEQKRAWKMYSEAARALERYQNSGGADIQSLENAVKELYAVQSSLYYRRLDRSGILADLEKNEADFRRRLSEIYRLTRQETPADLSSSLLVSSASAAGSARFKKGDSWIEFGNTPNRILAAGDLWTLLSLRAEWDENFLTLTYKMGRLEADVAAPRGFGRLLLDTYIDLNHVVGAGSTRLLEGRGSFIQSRDAWEYALSVSGWGCSFYRFDPRGAPVKGADCALQADLRGGSLQIKVPRGVLRGNPARWGYVALVLETDRALASQSPPKPLRRGGQTAILGLLEQDPGAGTAGIPERLGAVRAP